MAASDEQEFVFVGGRWGVFKAGDVLSQVVCEQLYLPVVGADALGEAGFEASNVDAVGVLLDFVEGECEGVPCCGAVGAALYAHVD